jgi:hypothetical protein
MTETTFATLRAWHDVSRVYRLRGQPWLHWIAHPQDQSPQYKITHVMLKLTVERYNTARCRYTGERVVASKLVSFAELDKFSTYDLNQTLRAMGSYYTPPRGPWRAYKPWECYSRKDVHAWPASINGKTVVLTIVSSLRTPYRPVIAVYPSMYFLLGQGYSYGEPVKYFGSQEVLDTLRNYLDLEPDENLAASVWRNFVHDPVMITMLLNF